MKLLFYLIMVMVAVESYSFYRFLDAKPNHWPSHIYMVIEFVLFFLIFKQWQSSKIIIKAINYVVPTFLLFCIINYIFFSQPIFLLVDGLIVFNSWALYNFIPIKIAVVFFTAISAFTILQLFENDRGDILEIPAFWVSSGLLFFSSVSIVYFILVTFVVVSDKYAIYPAITMTATNVMANSFYAMSFIVQWKHSRDCSPENIKDISSQDFML